MKRYHRKKLTPPSHLKFKVYIYRIDPDDIPLPSKETYMEISWVQLKEFGGLRRLLDELYPRRWEYAVPCNEEARKWSIKAERMYEKVQS